MNRAREAGPRPEAGGGTRRGNAAVDRRRIAGARRVLRGRGRRFTASDLAYRLYMGALLALIIVAPVVRAGVLWLQRELQQPDAGAGTEVGSAALADAGALTSFGALAPALTAATVLLVLAGSRIGPARATLPQLDLVFVAPISRARLLRPTVARWLGLGAGLGAIVAGIGIAARALHEPPGWGEALWLLAACASAGILMAAAPLAGQLGRRTRAVAATLLLALAATQAWLAAQGCPGLLHDPWSHAAGLLLGGAPQPVAGLGAVLAAAIVAVRAPAVAARLPWEQLRTAALQLDTVQTLVLSGDPGAGLARLGAPVRLGRRVRLRVGGSRPGGLTVMILTRDLLGIARTPGRSSLGALGIFAAGALWSAAVGSLAAGVPETGERFLLPYVASALLGAVSMLLAYLSAAPWCRGLATAAQGSGLPPLLPSSPALLIVRHAIAPAVLAVAALGAGALAASVALSGDTNAVAGADIAALVVSAALAATVAVGLRASTALKGPIPLRLLAPVPTPAGDASGINVLLWTLDGQFFALFLGAGLAVVWALTVAGVVGFAAALVVSALVLAGVVVSAAVRLGRPANAA